ncbi:MAG: hypothetical protein IPG95_13485 [Saprospiraceae bacterium]|nr:hypothetical protein [Saprospiraceae bacterium]
MTAEIGLLNKSAVVLAADSAVTITKANKIFNNANKIFKLDNGIPIGFMIYNNSHWMGIPLETIIKEYKKYRNGITLPTVDAYTNDIVNFIKSNFLSFTTQKQVSEFVTSRIYDLLESFIEVTSDEVNEIIKKTRTKPKTITQEISLLNKTFEKIVNFLITKEIQVPKLIEFADYNINEFKTEYYKLFEEKFAQFCSAYKISYKKTIELKIFKLLFAELTHEFTGYEDYTGIVIAGFGDDELFPTISEIKLGEIISQRLRYERKFSSISFESSALVAPYAQRDMVDTFVQGIDPTLVGEIYKILKKEFSSIKRSLIKDNKTIDTNKLEATMNKSFESINKQFLEKRKEIHIYPVIKSISYLRKEDLVEIAEALVNITSLKRKTSDDLQTVGGPVDVAVISKGDGFVWVKRKEHFNRDINFIS